MIDVLRIAHLRIAPQEGNLEVGNCEGKHFYWMSLLSFFTLPRRGPASRYAAVIGDEPCYPLYVFGEIQYKLFQCSSNCISMVASSGHNPHK